MSDDPTTETDTSSPNTPRDTGRPVYESTLLPPRKRRRFSPWLIVPGLLLILIAIFSYLLYGPKPRRAVNTAGWVVYAAGGSLWTLPPGGSPTRLTPGTDADASPTFTADGNQIAFLSSHAGGPNQVFVMDSDGKNRVSVTRGTSGKSLPSFAPGSNTLLGFLSGASLAVINVGQGDASLILPTPKTQSARTDTTDPGQAQDTSSPVTSFAWQPSAADPLNPGVAAVQENTGVQTLALLPTLSSPPRYTQTDKPDGPPLAAADGVSPAWSSDGKQLAVALLHVAGLAAGQKASGIVLLDALGNVQHDAQGNAARPLFAVRDPALGPQNPVFSPDGSSLAVELWRQTDLASRARLGLFLVPLNGGAPRPLAKGDAGAAQFSRDGQSVYYLLRRPDGGHDLYRSDLTGSAPPTRLSDGQADIQNFALSPQAAKL